MAGYSGTPLVRKLGVRPNECLIALNAPEHYARLLVDLPEGVQTTKRLSAGCEDYTPHYYAVFFEDPDGNKLEICYRWPPAAK